MELAKLFDNNMETSVIQVTVTDKNKASKSAFIMFNPADKWFVSENPTSCDVLSHFSSPLMHSLERDANTHLIQADCFKIESGKVVKSISFCPMVRMDDNMFKSCIIYKDGSIEII